MEKGGLRSFAARIMNGCSAQQAGLVSIMFVSAKINGPGQTISPPHSCRRAVQLESVAEVLTFVATQQIE